VLHHGQGGNNDVLYGFGLSYLTEPSKLLKTLQAFFALKYRNENDRCKRWVSGACLKFRVLGCHSGVACGCLFFIEFCLPFLIFRMQKAQAF
jgi:hypothetical protein